MKWSRNVQFLREDLANELSRLEYGDDEEEVEVEEGENGYLVEFLRSAFLQPTKKGREEGQSHYMAHGHRAEEPFLKEFFEITQQCDAVVASNIVAVYAPGMIMNRHRMCNRDSANGVAIDNYRSEAVPVEVKSRASVRTFQKERNNVIKFRIFLLKRTSIHYSGKSVDELLCAYVPAYYNANESNASDKISANNSDTDDEK